MRAGGAERTVEERLCEPKHEHAEVVTASAAANDNS